MRILKKLAIMTLLSLAGAGSLTAANVSETSGDANAWFFLLNKVMLPGKWYFTNEAHLRRNQWFKEQQQFLIRPAVNYSLFEGLDVAAGYTYIETSPYGKYPSPLKVKENNIWEQVTLNHKIGIVKMS